MTYNPYLLMLVYALGNILLEGLIGTVPSVWTGFSCFLPTFCPTLGYLFCQLLFRTPSHYPQILSVQTWPHHISCLSPQISFLSWIPQQHLYFFYLTHPQHYLRTSLNGQKMAHLISKFSKIVTTSATIQTDDPNSLISKTSLLSTLIPASDQWVQY